MIELGHKKSIEAFFDNDTGRISLEAYSSSDDNIS